MRIVQGIKEGKEAFKLNSTEKLKEPLVMVFGNRHLLEDDSIYNEVKKLFPTGHIVFGSTSGEIINDAVQEVPLLKDLKKGKQKT